MKFTSVILSELEAKYVIEALRQLHDNIREIPTRDTKALSEDLVNIDGIKHKFEIAQYEEPRYLLEE